MFCRCDDSDCRTCPHSVVIAAFNVWIWETNLTSALEQAGRAQDGGSRPFRIVREEAALVLPQIEQGVLPTPSFRATLYRRLRLLQRRLCELRLCTRPISYVLSYFHTRLRYFQPIRVRAYLRGVSSLHRHKVAFKNCSHQECHQSHHCWLHISVHNVVSSASYLSLALAILGGKTKHMIVPCPVL